MELPRNLGPYHLIEPLGRGGAGEVFRAHDTRLGREVAIKRLRPELSDDPKARGRIQREARILAQLSHPSIVPLFDLVETPDGLWIVLERVEGPTLTELVHTQSVPIPRLLRLGRRIAEGLAAAHAQGILHRDLKTENVLVTADDRVRIVDFGLAKTLAPEADDPSLSSHGAVLGTLRSMAPEQARGLDIDARSDLFSLGVLLYELLTGISPFRGATPGDTLARLCTELPPPIDAHRPDCPADLRALIERLLAKAPEQRPASADEVVAQMVRLERSTSPNQPSPDLPPENASLPSALDIEATWTDTEALTAPPATRRFQRVRGLLWMLLPLSLVLFLPWSSTPPGVSGEPEAPIEPVDLVHQGLALLENHELRENVDQAIDLLRRAADLDPRSAAAQAALAEAYVLRFVNTGQDPQWLELALPAAQRAVTLDPDLPSASVALGRTLTALGRLDDAEAVLQQTLATAPEHVQVLEALGRLHTRQGRFDDAERVLQQGLGRAPNDASLWAHLGGLHTSQRRLDDAEAAFRRVLALRPASVYALRNLAAVLQLQGRTSEAASELQQALALRPEATLYSNLGAVLFNQGLYSDAALAFEKALDLGTLGHNNVGWANLADAYRFVPGKESQTRDAYQRAIQLTEERLAANPDNTVQRSRLALYLAKRGDHGPAENQVQQLLDPVPSHPTVLYRLLVASEILGNRSRALTLLDRALERGYPLAEIRADPELFELRADPAFHQLVVQRSTTSGEASDRPDGSSRDVSSP